MSASSFVGAFFLIVFNFGIPPEALVLGTLIEGVSFLAAPVLLLFAHGGGEGLFKKSAAAIMTMKSRS